MLWSLMIKTYVLYMIMLFHYLINVVIKIKEVLHFYFRTIWAKSIITIP